jgi:hypothetical protein
MTQDVTILYQGGSGGFALYYYLLLTGQFQHSVEETWELIHHQFSIDLINSPSSWKTFELWPDNVALKQKSGPRLFLICNPLWSDNFAKASHAISKDTHRILLYAPLKLQLRMAWEKRAYWFTDTSRQEFFTHDSEYEYIRWIRQSGVDFNGITVDPLVPQIINEFKPAVILSIKELLSEPATPDQKKFLDLWVKLQPKKSLSLMNLLSRV